MGKLGWGLGVALTTGLAAPVSADEAGTPVSWASEVSGLEATVRARGVLSVKVVVPLCSNAQIDCGSSLTGHPDDLEHNLYWGAVFGMRRFFDRKGSGYERVWVEAGDGPVLERVVYRRWVDGTPWGRSAEPPVELLVTFDAVDGGRIDDAVDQFWTLATRGGEVTFVDAGDRRTEAVHVAGYAGHNRLMDAKRLPDEGPSRDALPSFVLACYSASYFREPMVAAGVVPLVFTRALIAPEAYVVDGIVRALASNTSVAEVRRGGVAQYAAWHQIDYAIASGLFAKED